MPDAAEMTGKHPCRDDRPFFGKAGHISLNRRIEVKLALFHQQQHACGSQRFGTLPMRNFVAGQAGTRCSRSAYPNPSEYTIFPSIATVTENPGMPRASHSFACRSAFALAEYVAACAAIAAPWPYVGAVAGKKVATLNSTTINLRIHLAGFLRPSLLIALPLLKNFFRSILPYSRAKVFHRFSFAIHSHSN
jgi:hypothetical protein